MYTCGTTYTIAYTHVTQKASMLYKISDKLASVHFEWLARLISSVLFWLRSAYCSYYLYHVLSVRVHNCPSIVYNSSHLSAD